MNNCIFGFNAMNIFKTGIKIVITAMVLCIASNSVSAQTATDQWRFEDKPVWSDEFSINGAPDTSKWTLQTGGGGWGNDEKQYYTKQGNAFVENGLLKIVAKKENKFGSKYTSARMITRNNADWKYGRFEIRLKLPKGRGTWPAVWMLPDDYYGQKGSSYGEIDLMEHVGYDPHNIYFSVHFEDSDNSGDRKTDSANIKTAESEFHVYRMDWTPFGIRGYVDDKKYFELLKSKDKRFSRFTHRNFFMILNLAIGGDWGGHKGIDKNIFPVVMEVDYIRVYSFLN